MSEFFYLIPISIVLGALGLVVFLWTLRTGQYDDLDGAAERILYDEDEPIISPSDAPPDADDTGTPPTDPPSRGTNNQANHSSSEPR
jgi:cbb3-type cytochrome oxidase maturation protein